jgi:hypothetical protein
VGTPTYASAVGLFLLMVRTLQQASSLRIAHAGSEVVLVRCSKAGQRTSCLAKNP